MTTTDRDEAEWPETVTVTIDAMAHGGAGMGREASGRMVFVDGGVPGETVVARIDDGQERFAHASLDALPEEPSPDRVIEPRCEHAGTWPERGHDRSSYCGGCTWSHLAYEAQLVHKSAVVHDALRRIGRILDPPVAPARGMKDPWGYRNRVDMHAHADGLGFVAADSVTVTPISMCHIAHPTLVELQAAVDPGLPVGAGACLRVGIGTGDRMIVLFGMDDQMDNIDEIEVTSDASVALARYDGGVDVVAGRRYLFEKVAGHTFAIPPTSFFQVNTEMAHELVALVQDAVPSDTGMLVDAYGGVGLFTLCLADRVSEMVSIEGDPAAVQAAVLNAEGLENVTILEGDVAEGLQHLETVPDVVVVDPPRAGLSKDVMRLLTGMRPHRIVYVSCDPSTLARDASQLVSGDWRLLKTDVVDMFPHTHHIETVSVFQR